MHPEESKHALFIRLAGSAVQVHVRCLFDKPQLLRFVRDGEELFDYLRHSGEYVDGDDAPLPDLILLDLKMPKKDGREVLQEIKSDPRFKRIPVVALTTSTAADDVGFSYEAGVNSYVTKPATFRELVDLMNTLSRYWFELAELPPIE